MRKLDLFKWMISRGRGKQEFLGARWVPALLRSVPAKSQEVWALRLLGLSPHYLFRERGPQHEGLSSDDYLKLLSEQNIASRRKIFERVVRAHLQNSEVAIDYGCGPGYLASIVAKHITKVYGIDISRGALACAEVLHGSDNIVWVKADEEGLSKIPDESVDLAFSFHVFQHLTKASAQLALEVMYRKLKKGGKILLHFQVRDDTWKTEADWVQDKTVRGRARMRYGLHCFGITLEELSELLSDTGFSPPNFTDMRSYDLSDIDDVEGKFVAESFRI